METVLPFVQTNQPHQAQRPALFLIMSSPASVEGVKTSLAGLTLPSLCNVDGYAHEITFHFRATWTLLNQTPTTIHSHAGSLFGDRFSLPVQDGMIISMTYVYISSDMCNGRQQIVCMRWEKVTAKSIKIDFART